MCYMTNSRGMRFFRVIVIDRYDIGQTVLIGLIAHEQWHSTFEALSYFGQTMNDITQTASIIC